MEVIIMSESDTGHHAHHSEAHHVHTTTHHKQDVSPYILPASILLASLIVAWAVMSSGAALENSLSGLITLTGDSTGNVNPPAPDAGDLGPPRLTNETMTALLADAPASDGSSSADIVVIEYSDYQCPFCQRWFTSTKGQFFSTFVDTGIVEFAYKDFPLANIHPQAEPMARAARCAGDQGKYWEMHDAMFTNPLPSGSAVSMETMQPWIASVGLNETQFGACFNANTYASEVQANFAEGQSLGVSGTPSFVIGLRGEPGQLIVGACPFDAFQTAINAIREGKDWQQIPNSCTVVTS